MTLVDRIRMAETRHNAPDGTHHCSTKK